MQRRRKLSRYCVYTLCGTERLGKVYESTRSGGFEENRAWVSGEQLFTETRDNDEQMPVHFAAAEKDRGVLYYAIVDTVEIDRETGETRYAFAELTPLERELPKSSLLKKNGNTPLPDNDQRPYRNL